MFFSESKCSLYPATCRVLMRYSVYRFTFEMWPFFAVVTVTAYVLIIVTFGLGFVCRLNYGKGLKHFRASISFPTNISETII